MVGVRDCSYSILREVESLSRLTALTLKKCSEDVIYKNLDLPSKLARYALEVGCTYRIFPNSDDYDKTIVLEFHETAPLGDWIHKLLKDSEAVYSIGKVCNDVLSVLQVNELQNVKSLCLDKCDLVTYLLNMCGRTHEIIKFPNLYDLELDSLKCLTHFCSDNVEGIEFPRLRKMVLRGLPEFQNFWPTPNNSVNHSNPLFHEKVSCPYLEEIHIDEANNMNVLCSHQLPTDYFKKLVKLNVCKCEKLRNLMSPSVARGFRNLKILSIKICMSMEEVIIEEEQQGEGTITLFPMLEQLTLVCLPKLRHFFLTECALKFPLLRKVKIEDCLEMKTFDQKGICESTPNLEIVEVKADDHNKVMFHSKVSCPNLEELVIKGANNMSSLCSHQLPIDYFNKLGELRVWGCPKLRNLMSLSVAKRLLNLRTLAIRYCDSMEEVIIEEEQEGERIITLLSLLKKLELESLPKLRYFFLTKSAHEFPSLREVQIKTMP